METQFKKGAMDLCVLSLLKEKDYYGYELVQKISKYMEISEGTLYPILRRLKLEGYLKTAIRESNEGPSRKYYSLTRKGEEKEIELSKEWKSFVEKVSKMINKK